MRIWNRLPSDHVRGERASRIYRTDATSQTDQSSDALDMHLADLYIALAKLKYIKDVNAKTLEAMLRRGLTSMAASVMTEFIVASCIASTVSSILRRSRATESVMSISEA